MAHKYITASEQSFSGHVNIRSFLLTAGNDNATATIKTAVGGDTIHIIKALASSSFQYVTDNEAYEDGVYVLLAGTSPTVDILY